MWCELRVRRMCVGNDLGEGSESDASPLATSALLIQVVFKLNYFLSVVSRRSIRRGIQPGKYEASECCRFEFGNRVRGSWITSAVAF